MDIVSMAEAKSKGLKVYFTGKQCKHGHAACRRTANGSCCQCIKEDKDGAKKRQDTFKKKRPERLREIKIVSARKHAGKRKAYQNEYIKRRRASDDSFRLKQFIRDCIHRMLRKKLKTESSSGLVGYSSDELKQHLESLFQPGMSWSNYGKEWHIDHICPISFFIYLGEDDPAIVNALENLQPLWKKDNIMKSGWKTRL
jgi:hypothetical protein